MGSGTSYGPGGDFFEALISRSLAKGGKALASSLGALGAAALVNYGLIDFGFSIDQGAGVFCVNYVAAITALLSVVVGPAVLDQVKRRFVR